MKAPRNNSLVRFKMPEYAKGHEAGFQLADGDVCLFLGDIPNKEGHAAVIRKSDSKLVTSLHVGSFIELTEDEL